MTLGAISSETPPVYIILAVTTPTISRSVSRANFLGAMTCLAGHRLVGTFQRKLGLRVVVKSPKSPAVGVMAGTTLLTQGSMVLISISMTVHTSRVGFTEALVFMAGFTWGNRMTANQGERGHVVIKTDSCQPTKVAMAVLASSFQISLVNIGVQVAT